MKYLWMKVTNDKYQLPLVVADTSSQLAELCGVNKEVIFRQINRQKKNPKVKPRYIRVEYMDEEFD